MMLLFSQGKTPLLLLAAMCEQVADPALEIAAAALPAPVPLLTDGSARRSAGGGARSGRAAAASRDARAPPITVAELCEMAERLIDTDEECVDMAEAHGWTPLMTAAEWGCLPLVRLLLERGASVDTADLHGKSALHWSVCEDGRPAHADVIACLLDAQVHADCLPHCMQVASLKLHADDVSAGRAGGLERQEPRREDCARPRQRLPRRAGGGGGAAAAAV